jgi:hypothetical protein
MRDAFAASSSAFEPRESFFLCRELIVFDEHVRCSRFAEASRLLSSDDPRTRRECPHVHELASVLVLLLSVPSARTVLEGSIDENILGQMSTRAPLSAPLTRRLLRAARLGPLLSLVLSRCVRNGALVPLIECLTSSAGDDDGAGSPGEDLVYLLRFALTVSVCGVLARLQ